MFQNEFRLRSGVATECRWPVGGALAQTQQASRPQLLIEYTFPIATRVKRAAISTLHGALSFLADIEDERLEFAVALEIVAAGNLYIWFHSESHTAERTGEAADV